MKFIIVLMDFLEGHVQFYKDEKVKVTREEAARFCSAGWAQDLEGEYKTGAPNTGDTKLVGIDSKHGVVSPQAGG